MELDIGLSDHMLRDDAIFLIISYNKVYDVFWCASKVVLDTYKQLNLKSSKFRFPCFILLLKAQSNIVFHVYLKSRCNCSRDRIVSTFIS